MSSSNSEGNQKGAGQDAGQKSESMSGPIEQIISEKLMAEFNPHWIAVQNESHMHSVPPDSETHFKVTLVSDQFEGKRQVARHQRVYATLTAELSGPVHALALHTYTQTEWAQKQTEGGVPASPDCRGGSKHG